MKRQLLLFTLTAAMAATGCSMLPKAASDTQTASSPSADQPARHARGDEASVNRVTVEDAAGRVVVQKVEFRPGVSSATVERLAMRFGCAGSGGAGLLTAKGPVEVYRLQCDNGTTFLAQCELRQCRPMR